MHGHVSHLDLCVGSPDESIPFYDTLLTALGYERRRGSDRQWQEPNPERAAWAIRYPDGTVFGIDLRPATSNTGRRFDPNEPGPHHLALHAESDHIVDEVHRDMQRLGALIADAPANYGGRPGYGTHYYALFLLDPDGFKIEVVHARGFDG